MIQTDCWMFCLKLKGTNLAGCGEHSRPSQQRSLENLRGYGSLKAKKSLNMNQGSIVLEGPIKRRNIPQEGFIWIASTAILHEIPVAI